MINSLAILVLAPLPLAPVSQDQDPVPTREVLVLDEASGAPVPGAQLRYLRLVIPKRVSSSESRGTPLELLLGKQPGSQGDLLAAEGERIHADESGIALLPEDTVMVSAEAGERWGMARLMPRTRERVELRIAPLARVAIQVRGPDGKPCSGVPLRMDPAAGGGPVSVSAFWRGESAGSEGQVDVSRAFAIARQNTNAKQVWVSIEAPLAERVEAAISLTKPPPAVIAMALPATGRVVVRLKREGDEPLPERMMVTLDRAEPPKRPFLRIPPGFQVEGEDGQAVFPYVGLGLELRVAVMYTDKAGMARLHKIFTGPRRPGEIVTVELERDPRAPVIVGAVFDAAGKPLAEAQIKIVLELRSPHQQSGGQVSETRMVSSTTDADGRFRLELEAVPESDTAAVLHIHHRDRKIAGSPPLERRLELKALESGENDVGRVHLEPAEATLEGSVVDDQGAPVADARVVLETIHRRADDKEYFMPLKTLQSGPQGRFALYRERRGEGLRVQVRKAGYKPTAPSRLDAQENQIRLVLEPAGPGR